MKYNTNRETWSAKDLRYWREGDVWKCAVPRDDFCTRAGLSWKTYGLVGTGKTKEEARKDWESWKRCSDLVADIY
jgi:hypothetical protein